ncbi:MAG: DUF1501 domain-containing protein [Phycisphaeraceae bacterium]|nr:DUF1501 domain-containing protein [Phycisphaeraceae bacterium]
MDPRLDFFRQVTRRHFLSAAAQGVGGVALAGLLGRGVSACAAEPVVRGARAPHFAARAKRVIYLHMAGSPPQQDLLDYKPRLNELNGQLCPADMLDGERFAFIKGHPRVLGSPYAFERVGSSGAWVSELLPHFKGVVDDVTIVRSMHTEQFNHAPAQLFLYTGSSILGRPSMGSWVVYGLGSEADDLPGFVVLVSGGTTPSAGKSVWGSGFLPSVFQGVQCRSAGDPVLYVRDPQGMSREGRRASLDALADLNAMSAERHGDPETASRVEQYELAFRMQMSVPEVMDISRESPETLSMYGASPGEASFANNCLLARRLAERGVRFIQLFDWGWDTHGTGPTDDIVTQLPLKCRQTDRPIAALIADLKRRGMLDDTLVVWSGEFGRTAMNEERDGSKFLGRDHHPHCFSIWMAGGGAPRGKVYGETDEFGCRIARDPVHVHDFQATMLHLLGVDHERLTYRYQGRDFRLTDVYGKVVPGLIA